ncbi:hypothetical protein Bca52824_058412 [Brassica carinata]|uniref:Uncharacterized protein n=1 Tax=Brassica carinata TaxID=52824 RepID=A0A8X7QT68_BRACI|nr:hypothetical protein Bca52824_058412 [Brassica carinata]
MAPAWDPAKNPICLIRASARVKLLVCTASEHAISAWTRRTPLSCAWTRRTPLSCKSTRITCRVDSLAVVVVTVVLMIPPICVAGDEDVTIESGLDHGSKHIIRRR